MNAEQKQRALAALGMWHSSNDGSQREYQSAELMAALLQELVDAPEVLTATNPSQISSSAEPPADVAQWIDPNDKTQKQFLPHIGERVLFCRDGKTYYGKHTGGSFISFTNPGKYYPTWDCRWMYPPKAIDAAIKRQGGES